MLTGPTLADDPKRQLTLRQADQARSDSAAIENNLECIMGQLSLLAMASAWALLGWSHCWWCGEV